MRTKILNNAGKFSAYHTTTFSTHVAVTVYTEDTNPVKFSVTEKTEEEFHQDLREQAIKWFPEDSTEL